MYKLSLSLSLSLFLFFHNCRKGLIESYGRDGGSLLRLTIPSVFLVYNLPHRTPLLIYLSYRYAIPSEMQR